MYLISYRAGDVWRAGVSDGARAVDVASLGDPQGDRLPTVRALLEAGPEAVAAALLRAGRALEAGDDALALDAIAIGPPVPDPDKVICLGLNYRDHAAEIGLQPPPVPVLFPKYRNALVGPQSPIVMPRQSREIDYEAELAGGGFGIDVPLPCGIALGNGQSHQGAGQVRERVGHPIRVAGQAPHLALVDVDDTVVVVGLGRCGACRAGHRWCQLFWVSASPVCD